MKLKMQYFSSRKFKPRCELIVYCQWHEKNVDVRKKCWNCEEFAKQEFHSIECSFKGNSHYIEDQDHKIIISKGSTEKWY